MENITLNDFSGGMVENVSPTDFSPRQWAELKGFVPSVDGVMESQWAFQKVGYNSNGNGDFVNLHAVSVSERSTSPVYLLGIKSNGTLWFTRLGSTEQTQTSLLNNVTWYQVAEVTGDVAPVLSNSNARFLCDLPFEGYKYGYDSGDVTGLLVDTGVRLTETVPGVLIGSRVDDDGSRSDNMFIAFLDHNRNWDTLADRPYMWRTVSFPRADRVRALEAPNPSEVNTFISNVGMLPYAYTDGDAALNPGVGVIPRANIATMWNNSLIIGDVYWRKENSDTAAAEGGNWKVAAGLTNSNTVPFEGSVMYSSGDIDVFDPRALIRLSQTDTAIQGLHVLNNTLIGITSYASENDGVIAIRGDLSQLISYSSSVRSNPFAIRREIVRGGLGFPSRYVRTRSGQRRMSCMWPEAGIVVFLDKMGGVFYTDSERVDRLDQYGPTDPSPTNLNDTVGAVGRHLFVWRNRRLFCLTMLGSGDGGASGCWTEIALPREILEADNGDDIGALIGARDELYVLWKRQSGAGNYEVWRFSLNCPDAERGKYFSGTEEAPATADADLVISTRTLAVDGESRDPFWHRLSFNFETPTSCQVRTVRIQSIGAKKRNLSGLISGNKIGHYTWSPNRTFNNDNEGEIVVPAAIGAQSQASATITVRGYIRLESVSFTVSGSRMNRGEVPG